MKNVISSKLMFILAIMAPFQLHAQPLAFEDIEPILGNTYHILESSSDGKFIYAVDSTAGVFEVYGVAESGVLTNSESTTIDYLKGAQVLAFSPKGDDLAFVGNSSESMSGVYALSRGSGAGPESLKFRKGDSGADEDSLLNNIDVKGVSVSSSGNTLFVVGVGNSSDGDSPADDGEGVLAIVEDVTYVSTTPERIQYSNITYFQATDGVDSTRSVPALAAPTAVISAGDSVYVISNGDESDGSEDAFIHFDRDSDTGKLTFSGYVVTADNVAELTNPTKLMTRTKDSVTHVFVGTALAAGKGYVLQFDKAAEDLQPSLARSYTGKMGKTVKAWTAIRDLLVVESVVYVVTANMVTPLLLREGVLQEIEGGRVVVSGGNANGLQDSALITVANGNRQLYVTSSTASPGLSRWSRVSDISLVVKALNRGRVQPGQVVGFNVVATNNGPADAPDVEVILIPTHVIVAVSGPDKNLCESVLNGGKTRINCRKDMLAVSDTIELEISMRPTRVGGTLLRSSVRSSNAGGDSEVASDADRQTVGSFNNGALAMAVPWYAALLLLYVLRCYRQRQ